MTTTDLSGRYVYAIVELWATSDRPEIFPSSGMGGIRPDVTLLRFGTIGAFVSPSSTTPYPLSRENMLRHEQLLEEIMKHYTLLPLQFSTIAQSELEVCRLLEKEHDTLKAELEKLEGKREMGLKAIFHESIFNHIAERDPAVIQLKAEAVKHGMSQGILIEVGKAVERALEAEKARYRDEIMAILSPLSVEVRLGSFIGERMLLNAAFLIDDDKELEFDAAVNRVGDLFSDFMKFKYVGNAPPYNFVRMTLSLNPVMEGT